MADENTMRRLWRYKSDLEQELDEEKLIEILGKLKRLPVTISALQETGIGRVINGYRKREGVVGDLARKVVGLWKAVVETEVKTSRHRSPSQSPDNAVHDAEADDPERAEVEDPEHAEVEDPEHAEADDSENNSDNGSDANSWNSYKESDRSNQSSPRRKRKHSVDSASSHEVTRRSSESSKKSKHTSSKSGRFQVDSAGDHSSDRKKKHTQERGDFVEHGSHSRHAEKSTGHVASSKQDRHSSASLSKRDHDRKDNASKSKTGSSSSSHHNVNEKGDRHKTIDRRQRRHSLSPSEDDDDDGKESGGSLHSSKNGKPSSSSFHKHSSSSSSHKDAHSSHKHSSSSSSHKDAHSSHKHSANSHNPQLSDSHMQSPSLNAGSHSSTSSSHKHSSASSSHKHSSTSGSHKHSSSSDSHKNSDSHRHSSNSQRHSSESNKHSSSSHRHASSSTSHKHSSPSEAATSFEPSGQQKRTPEDISSKPQSSRSTSNTSHGQNSASSSSQRPAGSSRSRDHSTDHKKNSDHMSRHNKSANTCTDSKERDSVKHHSSHSSSKKPAVSDNESCAKELQDTSEKSQHSAHRSHTDEGCSDKHSSSRKHSEKENHEKKSSSSSNKKNNSNLSSDASDCKPSSCIDSENEKLCHSSIPGNKSEESKTSSSKFTKVKPATSTQKKTRHKNTYEQPDLDLFSEAIHFKAEPSSPVPRPSSSKQTDHKSPKPQPSSTSKPTAALSLDDAPSDPKAKAQSSISEHKNPSAGSSSLTDDMRVDTEDGSDSQQEYNKKYTVLKDKKRKKVESPVQDENMSFEDFMAFDEATVVKRGRSSAKSSTKASSSSSSSKDSHSKVNKTSSSSSSSSKDSHSKVNKTSGGNSLSAADLPTSSKTGFSVPVPADNVIVTELDILSMLPETQANYKPLRFNNYYRDEDERGESPPPLVDPDVIGTKNVTRTHVYSGRKHGITEVKSLYDLCMHVLIDNIDAIDCVGGIPYSILKPVLERCTAQQLYQLEDYNPHFLEDTDELWKVLSQRDFRGCKPDELETWRELYMRKFEERELKYQKLKQTMSTSISKGQAGRKAQLAYVDTVAKPPREVLRKQRQFGTGSVVTKNKCNIRGSSSGLRTYKPSSLVPAHNPMDDGPRMVKAMPPMLAKSIQMRKNMRR